MSEVRRGHTAYNSMKFKGIWPDLLVHFESPLLTWSLSGVYPLWPGSSWKFSHSLRYFPLRGWVKYQKLVAFSPFVPSRLCKSEQVQTNVTFCNDWGLARTDHGGVRPGATTCQGQRLSVRWQFNVSSEWRNFNIQLMLQIKTSLQGLVRKIRYWAAAIKVLL